VEAGEQPPDLTTRLVSLKALHTARCKRLEAALQSCRMSLIHVQQIRAYLQKTFGTLIDLGDFQSADADLREVTLLTRSQAAFVVALLAGTGSVAKLVEK
jgi:hypothetical protein